MKNYIVEKLNYDLTAVVLYLNKQSENEVKDIVTRILKEELGATSVNLNCNSKSVNICILIEQWIYKNGPQNSGITYL